MTHARERPEFGLHLKGTHAETVHVKIPIRQADGTTKEIEQDVQQAVTDFDFIISAGQHICLGPIHWSVPDEQAAYRGQLYPEVDRAEQGHDPERGQVNTRRERASDEEIAAASQRIAYQQQHGLPPWSTAAGEGLTLPSTETTLRSSRSLREWAHEYCRSNKVLKEFRYEKRVYGWNIGQLEAAVGKIVQEAEYTGSWSVKFITWRNVIRLYPDAYLARALAHTWVKIVLWLFLIYPFLWLFKHFDEHGGGKWEVCGGAYALKYWDPNPHTAAAGGDNPAGRVVQTPQGPARVVGLREGEWFKQWESTIRTRIKNRFQSTQCLTTPDAVAVQQLDGY
ncbi:hypothetical protein C8Q73DRAFT_684430 [Cubamyces lactineus]|nr:hypothetical protein C8Q73DRAFT_684430 [Cubamyces lactineus]